MVELRETGNIMVDMARMMITSGSNGQKVNGGTLINTGQKKPPELKATLYTWRERLPNKWDALKDWDDIFCWRTEVRLFIFAVPCFPSSRFIDLLLCFSFYSLWPHSREIYIEVGEENPTYANRLQMIYGFTFHIVKRQSSDVVSCLRAPSTVLPSFFFLSPGRGWYF